MRVYNAGQHSVTVKPEDILLEDVVAGHAVAAIPGAELARRMRKSYNMARFGVNAMAGSDVPDSPITSEMTSPQFLRMMRAMAARANSGGGTTNSMLYTDTPGALESDDETGGTEECDVVCRLRTREGQSADVLAQLQRQSSPDFVEQCALLSNTIPPRANASGVLYFPLGKLDNPAATNNRKKARPARVTVPIGGESFQLCCRWSRDQRRSVVLDVLYGKHQMQDSDEAEAFPNREGNSFIINRFQIGTLRLQAICGAQTPSEDVWLSRCREIDCRAISARSRGYF